MEMEFFSNGKKENNNNFLMVQNLKEILKIRKRRINLINSKIWKKFFWFENKNEKFLINLEVHFKIWKKNSNKNFVYYGN